jgi:hypothetical protein
MKHILRYWTWLVIGLILVVTAILMNVESNAKLQVWRIYAGQSSGETFIYWPPGSGSLSLLIAPITLLVIGIVWWVRWELNQDQRKRLPTFSLYGLIAGVVITCSCLFAYTFSGVGDEARLEEIAFVQDSQKTFRILKAFYTFSDDAIAVYECDSWGLVCELAASHKVKDGVLGEGEVTSTLSNSTLIVSLNSTPVLTLPQG